MMAMVLVDGVEWWEGEGTKKRRAILPSPPPLPHSAQDGDREHMCGSWGHGVGYD